MSDGHQHSASVKGTDILYTATYRETRTAVVYNIRSGVLTSTSSKRRGAVSGRPHCPNERTSDPQTAVAARQTHLCPSQPHYGLHPATTHYFSSEYYQVYQLLLIYLPRMDGRLSWPGHNECK